MIDMSAEAIEARLRRVAELSDLRPDRRLHGKIDYSPEGIERRLRQVEQARQLCRKLGAAKE